jgi:hypothetical protein
MSIQVKSGPADVVESGHITSFLGNSIFLTLEIEESKTVVELIFDDEGEGEAAVESEYFDGGLRLICRHFGDSLGKGSAQPVLLGEAETKLIFFHFRVFRYGNTQDRTVHYTFYRVLKEDVGWKPVVEPEANG